MEIKVVHLLESLGLGGMERVVESLVRAQQPKARALCLCSEGGVAESMRRRGLPVDILNRNLGGGWQALPALVSRLKTFRPFLLHTHGAARAVGRLAGRLAGAKAIVHHIHGTEQYGLRQRAFERIFPADLYLACSEAARQDVVSQMDGLRVEVLYNPVDTKEYRFDSRLRDEGRQELGIREDQFVLLTIGRFVPEKGQRFLIGAIPEIIARHSGAVFVFIGDGPLLAQCQGQAQAQKADARFLGTKEDVRPYLNACDVYVQPSIDREAMPVAVLEAMACGRAVVATATQGVPEALGPAGILVPPGDVPALVEGISDFLDSSKRREDSGVESVRRADSQFSLSVIASRLERLYQEALKHR